MIRLIKKYFINFFVLVVLSSCSSVPVNTKNSCDIFSEKYFWYKHAKKTEKKWGTPIYLQLAIIKMESDFDWLARPARQKIFKVIPYKRPSSSFGYSQAVKGTWKQYKEETGNKYATRTRFKDSVDFIGWYTNKTSQILKISKKDVFRQYIAYHEGWGNYKNYKKKQKVILLAKKVQNQSAYRRQRQMCIRDRVKKVDIIIPPNIVAPTANLDPSPAPGPIFPTIKGIIAIMVLREVIMIGLNLKLQASLTAFSMSFPFVLN